MVCLFRGGRARGRVGDPLDDPNRHAWLMRVQWDGDMPVFDYRNLMNV